MEVLLYNSNICRLCAADNSNGTLLFSSNEGEQILGDLINNYLPLKVSDDGKLPQSICPGCNIQLEATVEFFNLIIIGQKVIRDLAQRETESLRDSTRNGSNHNENIVFQTFTSNGQMYTFEHPVALKMEGLDKPKRKRGRPPKKPKSEEPETSVEPPVEEPVALKEESQPVEDVTDGTRKRKRKTPQRFKEAVQGKELERMFREEGVLDGEESDSEKPRGRILEEEGPDKSGGQGQVIGHMEAPDGQPLGQLVVLNKGKGSGRPKGRTKWQRTQRCAACGVAFACARRYMRHVAAHGALRYACAACALVCDNLLELTQHHDETSHRGHTVMPTENAATANTTECVADGQVNEGERTVATGENGEAISAEVDTVPENTASSEKQSILLNNKQDVIASKQSENEDVTAILPESNGKYPCPQCDKVFNTNQSKELHVRATHVGERPYKCTECKATFPYPRSLAKHMVVHARRNNAGYACDLCGKVLKHPSSVTYHKEAAHGSGQRYVCSRCNKPFKHRQLLQRHQLVHSDARPFLCKLCPSSFKTKANLMNHQAVHSGIKKFVCEICHHSFAHKTSLTLHLRWHAGQKPFVCNVCGKAFSQKGNLSEHARIHTGEKPYACAHCPRTFTTSSQRRLHAQRHAGHRPFHCTYCSKRFLSKESWRAHMRRHRGELPFVCACGRGFAERWALHKHSRCHSGERPYACPHCSRTFADCSNLAKHKLIHREAVEVNSLTAEVEATEIASSEENKVVYVTYAQKDGVPTFHILAPDQAAQLGADEETLFEEHEDDVVLTEQAAEEEEQEQIEVLHTDHISIELPQQLLPVTDEHGNPIHLTMQDGTQLAITSSDGKSLQVTTEDGETIPVELNRNLQLKETIEDGQNEFQVALQDGNNLNSIEVSNDGRASHVDTNSVGEKDEMQEMLSANTADGQTVRYLTAFDDNTFSHYFTIV